MFEGRNAFEGIPKLHYFRFYLKDNKQFVQTKDYAHDLVWELADGYQCLAKVPEWGLIRVS